MSVDSSMNRIIYIIEEVERLWDLRIVISRKYVLMQHAIVKSQHSITSNIQGVLMLYIRTCLQVIVYAKPWKAGASDSFETFGFRLVDFSNVMLHEMNIQIIGTLESSRVSNT